MDQLGTDRLYISDFIATCAEAVCLIGGDNEVIEWNGKMVEATGVEKSLALGQSIQSIIPLFDQGSFTKELKKARKGNGTVCDDVFDLSNNKFYNVSFSPLKITDQTLVVAIFKVVKKEWLQSAESRFKPLIEESPIATAIYNPSGKPRYFNRAYGAIWGAKRGLSKEAIQVYNILEDEQLVEVGVMPVIKKAFAGETCEIPPVPYTPSNTHTISHLGLDDQKYVKGHIFPIKDKNGELEEVVLVLTDVTFQKKAEQILTDTQLKFEMLTVGLPGVIYEYLVKPNGKSKFRYISAGCDEMFGVPSDEALENEDLLLERIHPEDLRSFVETSKHSHENFQSWNWEGRIVVNDEVRWIEGKSRPAHTKNGKLIMYGMLLDISDKKKVEEQFKLTEERLKLALEGAELGLWEWDTKKRKTLFNRAWAKNFGYEHGELEKKLEEWAKLIHPDDIPAVHKKFNEHVAGKTEFFEAEYRFRTKDGNYRWILDKGKPVAHDEDGKVIKASGTYLDINDKKNSELLIERNEQLFTQLFENSPIGIVLLDEHHKVIQMNPGFEDIFGYSNEEIVGNKLNDIIVPDELQEEAQKINMLTTSGKVGQLESYRVGKSGESIPLLIYGLPVILQDKTIGIYGIYVDITERKKAEEELQIRNNELDNFVYKVSHDLRAPLSSILGLIHLANHEKNEDDIREYVAIIETRVKQLDSFINDVLSHSKNLKLAVSVEEIDLQSMVDKCFSDLNYLPKASTVKKEISIKGTSFYSDRWRVNEIFRNLISNAIKYLNPEIEDHFVKLSIDVSEHEASIVLEDNGIGIKKDTLPKVFEMFYRATSHAEGSGIGLYIVKNALEKLGGEIDVKSKSKKGTTFKISIPNKKEEYLKMGE